MKTLDRYIFWQVLKPLMLALAVALIVLMLERLLSLLDLILGAQGPLRLVIEIMTYLVPQYIGLALPISLLLGVMVSFNALGRNGEVDALQSSGVSLFRQARAAVLLAVLFAAVTTATIGFLKPFGRYAYQSAVFAVTEAAFHALLRAGVFTEFGNTTFLIDDISGQNGGFSGIFLYELHSNGGSAVITARSGSLAQGPAAGLPVLRLFDGERLAIGPTQGVDDSLAAQGIGVLRFAELRKFLSDNGSRLFRPRGVDEREYTLVELWRYRHAPPPGVRSSDMDAEFHGRIVRILTVFFLPFLAISLALGRRRSDRTYGIAIGLLLLIAYNQILDLGENVAENGKISPLLTLWVPLTVFAVIAVANFSRVATTVPRRLGIGWPSWLTPPKPAWLRSALARSRRQPELSGTVAVPTSGSGAESHRRDRNYPEGRP